MKMNIDIVEDYKLRIARAKANRDYMDFNTMEKSIRGRYDMGSINIHDMVFLLKLLSEALKEIEEKNEELNFSIVDRIMDRINAVSCSSTSSWVIWKKIDKFEEDLHKMKYEGMITKAEFDYILRNIIWDVASYYEHLYFMNVKYGVEKRRAS
jgi:hypothetical protein